MTDTDVPRDSRRVPIETRVLLRFDRFSGFISEYSSNISQGGMFIRSPNPEPVGTVLEFGLRLGDDYELIHGRGEVVWVRTADQESEGKPAGMGIRFLDLSAGSRELIYKMVENFVAAGGKPFDVLTAAPRPDPASEPASPGAPVEVSADVLVAAPEPASPGAGPASAASALPWPGVLGVPSPAPPAADHPNDLTGSRSMMFRSAIEQKRRRSRPLLWGGIAAAVVALALAAFLLRDRPPGPSRAPEVAPSPAVAAPAPPPEPASPEPTELASSSAAAEPEPPEPAEPAPAAPATVVERITWEETAAGTDVVLWADGAIRGEGYSRARLEGDPPRELIKVAGIRRPFSPGRLEVGTREVRQVRTGHHGGDELHVVLDLAGAGIRVTGIEEEPGGLRIHLAGS